MELQGTCELFAMKAMDKSIMLNRNKVRSIVFFFLEKKGFSLFYVYQILLLDGFFTNVFDSLKKQHCILYLNNSAVLAATAMITVKQT